MLCHFSDKYQCSLLILIKCTRCSKCLQIDRIIFLPKLPLGDGTTWRQRGLKALVSVRISLSDFGFTAELSASSIAFFNSKLCYYHFLKMVETLTDQNHKALLGNQNQSKGQLALYLDGSSWPSAGNLSSKECDKEQKSCGSLKILFVIQTERSFSSLSPNIPSL